MKRIYLLLIVSFLLTNSDLLSQEYLDVDVSCEIQNTAAPTFSIVQAWESPAQTATTTSSIYIGDLDGDDIPEVLSTHEDSNKLFILDGASGQIEVEKNIKSSYQYDVTMWNYAAIADVDDDGDGEIFIHVTKNGNNKLVCFDHNLDFVWESAIHDRPGQFGIADFNEDGVPEVYVVNQIFNAVDGIEIISGIGNWEQEYNAGPVAIDILDNSECIDCSGLELVLGGLIYSVDINNKTRTLVRNLADDASDVPINEYKPKSFSNGETNSFTSIADYNLDGNLDVLAVGAIDDRNALTTIFFWDVQNKSVTTFTETDPAYIWSKGAGRLNIADIDGDGQLNTTYVYGENLYALDENLDFFWRQEIIEVTSGNTGCTVFDFDGDGASEIVYRDEMNLYIVNGEKAPKPGWRFFRTIKTGSRTSSEYPIVADVDADGESEIIVSCSIDIDSHPVNPSSNRKYGHVRVYEAGNGERWRPSRKVWNQHAYYNFNVNDDLTIPSVQLKQTEVYPGKKPLNKFLNQAEFLNSSGDPVFPAADLTFDDSAIEYTTPTCPEKDFYVSFKVSNKGAIAINKKIYVSFYDGVPGEIGTNKLNTDSVIITDLKPNNIFQVDSLKVLGTGGDFDLFISLNDPVNLVECDSTNNIKSISIQTAPFQIKAEVLESNYKCDPNLPDNGKAKAFVWDGTNELTADYTFYWYTINGGIKDTVHIGSTFSNMAAIDYHVSSKHNAAGCFSTDTMLTIPQDAKDFEIAVKEIAPYTNCKIWDGILAVGIVNGSDTIPPDPNFYSVTWFKEGGSIWDDISSVSDTAYNVNDQSLTVSVVDKLTGCREETSAGVSNKTEKPEISIQQVKPNSECKEPYNGEITAKAADVSYKNDLIFYWFKGLDVSVTENSFYPDQQSNLLDSLKDGDYIVYAERKSNGCTSFPVAANVPSKTIVPDISFNLTPNTACVDSLNNGAIEVIFNNPSDNPNTFNIKWFEGANTDDSNLIATQEYLFDSLAPNKQFTVVIKHNAHTCEIKQVLTVDDHSQKLDLANLTSTGTDNEFCIPELANGTTTAKYLNQTDGYLFYWYDGSNVLPSASFIGNKQNGYIYQGLTENDYTVKAIEQKTGCASDPQTVTVNNIGTGPNLNFDITPLSSCDPSNPNGGIEVTPQSSPVPLKKYAIEIFRNTNRIDSVGNVNNYLAENLESVQYKFKVTNSDNGCSTTKSATVTENIIFPVIDASKIVVTDNTNCTSPWNGQIDGSNLSNVNFEWYDKDFNPLTPTTSTISDLNASFYNLIVKDKITTCPDTINLKIDDDPVYPSVSISIEQQQSACEESLSNGILKAEATDASGIPSGYSFEWFEGQSTTTLVTQVNGIGGNPASHLATDLKNTYYTVRVTNEDTRCSSTAEELLTKGTIKPVILASDINSLPNTQCEESISGWSGQLDASAIIGNYTYHWMDNSGDTLSETGALLDKIEKGLYELSVTDNVTGCSSDPVSTQVTESLIYPVVKTSLLANQTSCSSNTSDHNGVLSAYVDEAGYSPSGYNFQWYKGQGTLGTVVSSNDTATNLTIGLFTVQVTNALTGCSEIASDIIKRDTIRFEVSATAFPTQNCITPDGYIQAGIMINGLGEPSDGYKFNWYDSADIKLNTDFETIDLGNYANLNFGKYTVNAEQISTKCFSENEVTVEVEKPIAPALNALSNPPSDCHLSGVYIVQQASGLSNWTWNWYKDDWKNPDSIRFSVNSTTPMAAVDKIYTGHHTFWYKMTDTGCEYEEPYYLGFANIHTISANATNSNYCQAPFDGEISTQINIVRDTAAPTLEASDYSFYLYKDEYDQSNPNKNRISTLTGQNDRTTGPTFTDLEAGKYIVIAQENFLHRCLSEPVIDTVLIIPEYPQLNIAASNNYMCDANGNGVIQATASMDTNPEPAGGYEFTFFENDTSGTVLQNASTKNSLSGLNGGQTYAVLVENKDSRCETAESINLANAPHIITASYNTIAQDNCIPANGVIEINKVLEDNVDVSASFDYTISLKDENNNTLNTIAVANGSFTPFSNLSGNKDYIIVAINDSTKCESSLINVTLDSTTVNPVIVKSNFGPDTYCVSGSGNGFIEVEINQNGTTTIDPAEYSFEWFNGANSIITSNALTDQESGNFRILVKDIFGKYSGCVAEKTYHIDEKNPIIGVKEIAISSQISCLPADGSILVTKIQSDGIDDVLNNYSISLYTSDQSSLVIPSNNPWNNLTAGSYYLQAIDTAITGCVSSFKEVQLKEELPEINIIFTQEADYSCNLNGTGSISAQILEDGVLNSNYDLEWFNNAGALGVSSASINNIVEGEYTLQVTDNSGAGLGCAYDQSIYLNKALKDIMISEVIFKNQEICFPDGEAAVVQITENGNLASITDYQIQLLDKTTNPIQKDDLGTSAYPFDSLKAGEYFLSATNLTTDCPADMAELVILDQSVSPVLSIKELSPQTAIVPPNTPSGIVEATAKEVDGSTDLYELTWFNPSGSEIRKTDGVLVDTLAEVDAEIYSVNAFNQITGCETILEFLIDESISTPVITLSSNPMTICDPPNGSIEITSVSVAGNQDDVTNYSYELYFELISQETLISTSSGTPVLSGLSAGKYLVVAKENTLGIKSGAIEIMVEDISTKPLIRLDLVKPQTSFDPDVINHNGILEITVDGQYDISNFDIRWYAGDNLSGVELTDYQNSNIARKLTTQKYTVWVKNKLTNCTSVQTYYVPDGRQQIFIATSSAPNTNCIDPNGRASVRVVNPTSIYDYVWYEGTEYDYPNQEPDYKGKLLNNGLAEGRYTVIVFDVDDPYNYDVQEVYVGESLVYPEISISPASPLTRCDISRPDGMIQAITSENLSYANIEWFIDPDYDNKVQDGMMAMNVGPDTYIARITNTLTGCTTLSNQAQVLIDFDSVAMPKAELISNLKNCLDPDGTLSASVEGKTDGYVFLWHSADDPNFMLGTSHNMTGLNTGTYFVAAQSIESGCISDTVDITIFDERLYPEFDLETQNSNCTLDNGSASLRITNNAVVEDVIWDYGYMLANGYGIDILSVGLYSVTAHSIYGCSTSEDFEIKNDILVYKGISANGDSRNDYFSIKCIEDHPENNVKIFNRAGTLVYEIDNYDNSINKFEGYGNRGIYLGHQELPVGTYFYIIDLKDGAENRTGYVELIR